MFRGFELYYKFFSSDQSAERDAQASSLSTREQLASTSYGFKRMCAAGTVTQVYTIRPADRGRLAVTDTLDVVLDFTLDDRRMIDALRMALQRRSASRLHLRTGPIRRIGN